MQESSDLEGQHQQRHRAPDPPERRTPRRARLVDHHDEEEQNNDNACHDLPDVDEYKTQHGITTTRNSNTCRRTILIVIGMILLVSILITIGVVIGRDTASAESSHRNPNEVGHDSAPPRQPQASHDRLNQLIKLIEMQKWSDRTLVRRPETIPWLAAAWVALADPLQVDVSSATKELQERYALAVLYYSLQGDNWDKDKTSWLTADHACQWHKEFPDADSNEPVIVGIDCQGGTTVRQIYLPRIKGLAGVLPKEIHLLEDLLRLDLRHNQVTGGLQYLDNPHLRVLNMQGNAFKGPLPSLEHVAYLTLLNLSDNQFSSSIPVSFQNLQSLVTLNLERNLLTGTLEDSLYGLERMEAVQLGDNQISGFLENQIYQSWRSIQVIDLSDNQLKGKLPHDMFLVNSLQVLDLHGNSLSGILPDTVSMDSNVKYLTLHDNNLEGGLGKSLQAMKQLEHLDLSNNKFTGTMPTELGTLSNLRYLFLAFNEQFETGTIPTEYGSLTKLVDLSLQKTNRFQNIPTQLGQLYELVLLDLNQNILTGNLPPELGNLLKLRFLLLKDNRLIGSIPSSFSQLVNLDFIVINRNSMTGTADPICNPRLPQLENFIADCHNDAFTCACCTTCCATETDNTNDDKCLNDIFYSEIDPLFDENYRSERWYYLFHESGERYNVPP